MGRVSGVFRSLIRRCSDTSGRRSCRTGKLAKLSIIGLLLLFIPTCFPEDAPKPPAIDITDSLSTAFLDEDPRHLVQMANEAYQTGDYEAACKWYIQFLRNNPSDGGSVYNLACCFGLLGDSDQAARNLRRSYRKGYEDIEHMKNDPDFEKVRDEQVFIEAIDTIEKVDNYLKSIKGEVKQIRDYTVHNCNVVTPENYDPDRTYPLLIGLHGWGAKSENYVRIASRMGDDLPFIFACPQAPFAFDLGGELGYSWSIWTEDSLMDIEYSNLAMDYVLHTIEELRGMYNVSDIYLIGFSQGAGMTMTMLIEYPEIFSGGVAWAGWLDDRIPGDVLDKARDQSLLIVQGTEDQVVEFESAESALKTLQEHGWQDVNLLSFTGGHEMPEDQLKMAADWLKERVD